MQTLERLGAEDLVAVVTTYRDLLRAHQDHINLLNVYPVPDGDTGTNMALTLASVVSEVEQRAARGPEGRELSGVAEAISHGSLMGARGNSGVLLSQILRGLAQAFAQPAPHGDRDGGPDQGMGGSPAGGRHTVDAGRLTEALQRACEGAYQAVQNPVEGTILTVIRAAAEAAGALWEPGSATGAGTAGERPPEATVGAEGCRGAGGEGPSLLVVLEAARRGAVTALERTPDLLPVLKAAGVVDAGGSGLALLFDALLHVVDGRPVPEPPAPPGKAPAGGSPGGERRDGNRDGDVPAVDDLRYEVMYLLEAPDEAIAVFRQVWAGVGDSIVVVGGDGLYNCHIHTDDIGAAIEAALDVGRPRSIRVSDLWDQVEEERWVREAARGPVVEEPVGPVTCAVVAVCNGEGVRRIFHSLGVTAIVAGGQSMNPSTADILAALEAVPADQVVVLPNNRNIVPVAEAAAAQCAKAVEVVATVGVPEGFAALLEYDPEGGAAANAEAMTASAARVVAGEVTRAVRDSRSPAGPIRAGDWLGLSRQGIEVVEAEAPGAVMALLERLVDEAHHEMATLIVGEGASAADTRRITEWLGSRWPRLSVEVHHGGQPLYPYLVSIE